MEKALQTLNYPDPTRAIGGDGYADYIWYNRDELGYSQYFDYVDTPQFGDWCIFGRGGDTPASHVAMYVSDAGMVEQISLVKTNLIHIAIRQQSVHQISLVFSE